ncbi:unnamed protein product, partial [Prorocentrum cordatum]
APKPGAFPVRPTAGMEPTEPSPGAAEPAAGGGAGAGASPAAPLTGAAAAHGPAGGRPCRASPACLVVAAVAVAAAAACWVYLRPVPIPVGNGVAILVAGDLVRYFPNLDRHVVAPLARRGHAVDVYLSLSVEGVVSSSPVENLFVAHPAYGGKGLDEVQGMIAEGINKSGGSVGAIRIPARVTLSARGLEFQHSGTRWTKWACDKARSDYRPCNETTAHAQAARGSVAKLYQELEDLWTLAKEAEANKNEKYRYVMITRDDSNWLFDFDMDRLLQSGGDVMFDGDAGRAFAQRCGPPEMGGICNDVVVAEREVAEPFGSFYGLMTDHAIAGGFRNAFLKMKSLDIRLEEVPAAAIPFERCGRLNISGSIVLCRHRRTDEAHDGMPALGVNAVVPAVCEDLGVGL